MSNETEEILDHEKSEGSEPQRECIVCDKPSLAVLCPDCRIPMRHIERIAAKVSSDEPNAYCAILWAAKQMLEEIRELAQGSGMDCDGKLYISVNAIDYHFNTRSDDAV